jgi:hypothetical protein
MRFFSYIFFLPKLKNGNFQCSSYRMQVCVWNVKKASSCERIKQIYLQLLVILSHWMLASGNSCCCGKIIVDTTKKQSIWFDSIMMMLTTSCAWLAVYVDDECSLNYAYLAIKINDLFCNIFFSIFHISFFLRTSQLRFQIIWKRL